ncbi:MAG: hypothetical protein ABFR82_10060 [Nitrospirota bacterium]
MAIISILAVGAVAFAHGTGGWGSGNMMGGYGGHMMGQGYGGQMMGQGGQGYGTDKKFLDETADLRKDLHEKRFEYMEASRDPKIKYETLADL